MRVLQHRAQLQWPGPPQVDLGVAVADMELDRQALRGRRRERVVQQGVQQRLMTEPDRPGAAASSRRPANAARASASGQRATASPVRYPAMHLSPAKPRPGRSASSAATAERRPP